MGKAEGLRSKGQPAVVDGVSGWELVVAVGETGGGGRGDGGGVCRACEACGVAWPLADSVELRLHHITLFFVNTFHRYCR